MINKYLKVFTELDIEGSFIDFENGLGGEGQFYLLQKQIDISQKT